MRWMILFLVMAITLVCTSFAQEDRTTMPMEDAVLPEGAYRIVPATDEQNARNQIDALDLRELSPEAAADLGAGITTRLYGPLGPRNILRLRTDFATGGLLMLNVRAASQGGAYLAIRSGEQWYLQRWQGGEGTIEVGALYGVPIPAGEQEVIIKAPVGTVVVDEYVVFPDEQMAAAMTPIAIEPVAVDLGTADGYRGIWYYNQKSDDEYVYKYSGGLGTYCAKHIPFAVYSPEANRTFFVYGGTSEGERNLLAMASYYDHETGEVPRPTIVCDKQTSDAHDNPVIALAEDGHVWVFVSSHGLSRPSFVYRAVEPHSVERFELVDIDNFSYPQIHRMADGSWFFFHTLYTAGRRLHFKTGADLYTWSDPTEFAGIDKGHYQVTNVHGRRAATAFNYHPEPLGLNWRTNLYYMESADGGESWWSASGEQVHIPLRDSQNPALVHEWEREDLKVYMKDLVFDDDGRPVVLVVTSKGYESGPENDPRTWVAAHWVGDRWRLKSICTSDSNYDTGSLHIDGDNWTLIAPTETGPQPYNPGGEVAVWRSDDGGESWTMLRQITKGSEYNHTYVRRPVNAHPDFAGFWADGHARQPSDSRLYFCDINGERVRRLPPKMTGESARPEAHGGE
ncbi:MAG: BNR-4 repeat-containing protein [Armatimonadota bacterium]|jgi:hypothetical protein